MHLWFGDHQYGRDGKLNRGGAKSENSQKAFEKPIWEDGKHNRGGAKSQKAFKKPI